MATKVYTDQLLLSKDGHAHFFVSPQILGLIPQSQVRKFLSCASRKSQISKFVMINPQISLEYQSANRESAKLQRKNQCMIFPT